MVRARPEPPAVVYRNDPDIARATAVATRVAIKAAVAENVAVATYNRIVWTKSRFPTIRDLEVLSGENGGGLGLLSAVQRKIYFRTPPGALRWRRRTASCRR